MVFCQQEYPSPPARRFKTSIQVYFGTENQLTLSNSISASVDLSDGGLFLQTEEPLGIGEILLLRFKLLDVEKTITCNARVAWVNTHEQPCKPQFPAGAGVEFLDLSAGDRAFIDRYVQTGGK